MPSAFSRLIYLIRKVCLSVCLSINISVYLTNRQWRSAYLYVNQWPSIFISRCQRSTICQDPSKSRRQHHAVYLASTWRRWCQDAVAMMMSARHIYIYVCVCYQMLWNIPINSHFISFRSRPAPCALRPWLSKWPRRRDIVIVTVG